MPDASALAFIGVGSNIRPEEEVEKAHQALSTATGVTLTGISTFYRTAPLSDPASSTSPPDQDPAEPDPDFLNGVLEIHTSLTPRELRLLLDRIEESQGRIRPANRYAPRTIDLDLLLFGRVGAEATDIRWEAIGPGGLLVHADIERRPFVTHPLLELAPDLSVPPHGVPLRAFASTFDTAGGRPEPGFTAALRRLFLSP